MSQYSRYPSRLLFDYIYLGSLVLLVVHWNEISLKSGFEELREEVRGFSKDLATSHENIKELNKNIDAFLESLEKDILDNKNTK